MEKPKLDAFRRAVLDEPETVRAALSDPAFAAEFEAAHGDEELQRVPPGFLREHPLADMFHWKDVVFGRRLADEEVMSPDLADRLAASWATATPLFRFLSSL